MKEHSQTWEGATIGRACLSKKGSIHWQVGEHSEQVYRAVPAQLSKTSSNHPTPPGTIALSTHIVLVLLASCSPWDLRAGQ